MKDILDVKRSQGEALQEAVTGSVWTGDEAIAKARGALWNAAAEPQPQAFIECRDVQDVQQIVRFAADNGIGVAVLGGGHDWAGRAACKDGSRSIFARFRPSKWTASREPSASGAALSGRISLTAFPMNLSP